MSVSQVEYFTNPANYQGSNPRYSFGAKKRGTYPPLRVDWSLAHRIVVSYDGTNNVFTSYDLYDKVQYHGELVNGFALSANGVSVSVSGGNVYLETRGTAKIWVENTSSAVCVVDTYDSSKITAKCSGNGSFQLTSHDNSILEAEFIGGSVSYINQTRTACLTANDTSHMQITLGGTFDAAPAVFACANNSAILDLRMQDSAKIRGGANERGAVEARNNGTLNLMMYDDSQIVRQTQNQTSWFGLYAFHNSNINLRMYDNAKISVGAYNAYVLNINGTTATFDLDMNDNSIVECYYAGANGRTISCTGGAFKITLKDNAIVRNGGYGSSTCFALGGYRNSEIECILKGNSLLTCGLAQASQTGAKFDVLAAVYNYGPSHITIHDAREVKPANKVCYSVGATSGSSVVYMGLGKENGVKK